MMNSSDYPKKLVDAEIARRILARRRFLQFIKYQSPWFKESWHHLIIADALERIENGSLTRLMIFLPPRHSKSEMVSVHFPPWVFGRDKNKSIIEASYNDELASGFGRQARNIVETKEYRKIFDTTLAEDSKAKSVWNTNGRGQYNAVGIGGSVTGKGADILIIDDPIKNRKEADSFNSREAVYSWYKSTARTRLSPNGAIILVVTRWHDEDLAGKILSSENGSEWEVIKLPAIALEKEDKREIGDALWPQQFDLDNLLSTKADLGLYEWSALYQQSPINSETQEFKPEMFKQISIKDVQKKRVVCYITIDPAVKEKDTADYTGTTINFVDEQNNWHIMTDRRRINSTKLIDWIFELWESYKPEAIGIEETTYYDAVHPFLKLAMVEKNVYPVVYMLKHNGVNKNTRIRGLLPRYENNKILHIEGQNDSLEEEELRFPKGKHDDVVDSLAYQEQIAQPCPPEISRVQEVRNEMMIDERTGYLNS